MKFYVISYEDGRTSYAEFSSYIDVLNWAESNANGYEFTIEEYESENEYFESYYTED